MTSLILSPSGVVGKKLNLRMASTKSLHLWFMPSRKVAIVNYFETQTALFKKVYAKG